MTTLDSPSRKVARESHIDLAGTAWPLYKLEAVVGLVVLLVLLLVTATAQTAVLSAAAVATVVWWVRRAYYLRA